MGENVAEVKVAVEDQGRTPLCTGNADGQSSFQVEGRNLSRQSGARKPFNCDGVLSLLGGMLLHVVLGTLYCWGNFNSYTPRHMKNFDGSWDPANSNKADTLQLLSFTIVAQSMMLPFGAILSGHIGPSATSLFAGCLCGLGPFLASFTTSLGPFAFLYAGVLGAGIGIGYMPPIVCAVKHFPDSKGVVTGLILGAFGLGGFFFNYLGSAIFNPDRLVADRATKLYPDSVTDNFASSLRYLGMIYLVICVIAAPMIRLPKEESSTAGAASANAMSVGDAVATPAFWIMWFAAVAVGQGGLYTASSYKSIALQTDGLHGDTYLAVVGAVGSLANGGMRPLWGKLYDRIGYRACWSLVALLQAVVTFSFPFLKSHPALYAVGVVASFGALAGGFTLAPTECYKVFGNATVYGALYTSFAISGIFGIKIANKVSEAFTSSGASLDDAAFRFLCLMALFSFLIVQFHGKFRSTR